MNIAVNTIGLKSKKGENELLTTEVLALLVREQPIHSFFFFVEAGSYYSALAKNGATMVELKASSLPPLFKKFWFGVKLKKALKKIGADVFLSSVETTPLNLKLHRCLVLSHHESEEESTGVEKAGARQSKKAVKHIKKGAVIIAPSAYLKTKLNGQQKFLDEKIKVVHPPINPFFLPFSAAQKSAVKERFTEGKEYFLYTGDLSNSNDLLPLFKAFSVFKKRQQSSWKLVLLGTVEEGKKGLAPLLKTYKYRSDVVVTGALSANECGALTAAAYALLAPQFSAMQLPFVLGALHCGTPCAIASHPLFNEFCGEAGFYLTAPETAVIADALMLIYKDETLVASLVKSGLERATNFSAQQTAAGIWDALLGAAKHAKKG